MKLTLLILSILIVHSSFSQIALGEIFGKIVDEKGVELPFTQVFAYAIDDSLKNAPVAKVQSDFDGTFRISGIASGTYTLVFANYVEGMDTLIIEEVNVKEYQLTRLVSVRMQTDFLYWEPRIPECPQEIRIGLDDPFGRFKTIESEDIRRL